MDETEWAEHDVLVARGAPAITAPTVLSFVWRVTLGCLYGILKERFARLHASALVGKGLMLLIPFVREEDKYYFELDVKERKCNE